MNTPTQSHRRRALIVASLLLAGFGGLGYRLYYWQVVCHEALAREVNGNHERKIKLPAVRGAIFDCSNKLLAHSVPVQTVVVDPQLVRQEEARCAKAGRASRTSEMAALLSAQLDLPRNEVEAKLREPNRYAVLKRKVPQETAKQLEEMLREARLRGVVFEDDQTRVYPNGPLMSHVLGYMSAENKGVDGVEHLLQVELQGQDGWRKIECDRRGREIVVFRNEDFPARNGYGAALTLDLAIQNIAEQELDRVVQLHRPDSAVVIVMRPSTGEVLAMASRPTFDPNSSGKQVATLKNRAVADLMEPGSTFKIVTVAAALDQRILSLDDTVWCEKGRFLYGGRYLNDHDSFGTLTMTEVLVHSSNIGAAKIAIMLGNERMHRAMLDFGFGEKAFGEKPEEGWPGEIRGIVHPIRNWSQVSITRVAMGHEIGATPIQMANAMCAIANGGNLMRPQIIRRLVDDNGNVVREFFPHVRRRVMDQQAARDITKALKHVVSKEGTAERARVPGFEVAGKTGTAQKVVNGQYVHDQFVSSFVGFLPADDPELCVYVMLDNPKGKEYAGGVVAAPVFRAIAERSASYLNLKPSGQSFPASDPTILRAANRGVRP